MQWATLVRYGRTLLAWLVRDDTRASLLIAGFVLLLRLATLQVVPSPDASRKWGVARTLLHGESITRFDHHTARWAINLPVLLCQAIFGDSAWVQYVPILVFDVLLGLLTFHIGRKLAGDLVGALAVVMLTLLPPMRYLGSGLMPTVFESAYILGALYALLRAGNDTGRRWVAAAWLCCCAVYFAKETVVFFFPGLLLTLWLLRRRVREVVACAVGFIAVVGLETLLYWLTLGVPRGRLSIIARYHFSVRELSKPLGSFWDLFERYAQLSLGFRELFYAALTVTLGCIGWRLRPGHASRRDLLRPELLGLLATCWSYFLATTFALKRLSPPQLAQPAHERYLLCAAPLLALLVAWAIGLAVSRLRWMAWPGERLKRWGQLRSLSVALLAVLCVVATSQWQGSMHALSRVEQYESQLQAAFESGVPILSLEKPHNATTAVRNVYLTQQQSRRSKLLVSKRKGIVLRVLLDRKNPLYRGLPKRQLMRTLKGVLSRPHLEVSTQRSSFTVRTR